MTPGLQTPAGQEPAAPLSSDSGEQRSALFPALFQNVDPDRRLVVFEVGSARPDTVAFFSGYRCRLHFGELYADLLPKLADASLEPSERSALIRDALALPPGARLDLCLLWDFPNYLDEASLHAFSRALKPFLHPRTLGHAIGVHNSGSMLPQQQYGIIAPHTFSLKERPRAPGRVHPHPQAEFRRALDCFRVDRGMLLPDGRMEMLLKAR